MSVGARRAAPSRVLACAIVAFQLLWAVTAAEHGSGVQAQRGVSVSLRAKWEGTPIALEAAEFLADEESAKFWEYVERLQTGAPFSAGSGTCWSKILEQASRGLSRDFAKVLRTFLSTRHYSAKLEMYRSMARAAHQDACCWVQMGTVTSANASRLSAAVESALLSGKRELLHPFDHIYQPNATLHAGDEALPGAVLYGTPGTACFAEMHAVMVDLAQRQQIQYALRPMLAQGCASEGVSPEAQHCLQLGTGEQLPLPGYGVELAIKNMEYKAIDDSSLKAKAQDDYSLGTEQGNTEIAGFLFHKLLDRKPEASRDLESFRDHLLSRQSSEEDETLKVWDLKDLGLQAVQRISSASDPLRLLMEVSQNFPALATSLSRIQVAPALRSEVKRIQQSLPSGTNFLLLNGLMVDVDSLELYSLLERVRHDSRLVDQFHLAGVPQSSVTKLLALRPAMVQEETAEMRVDIGTKPPVMFLNDLEKDRMYSGWPTSLQVLLMPSFGGQMQPVARNVFTAVYVMDPLHEKAHKIVRNIVNYWKQGVPVRFGVQLVPQSLMSRAIAALRDGQSLRPLVWDETDVSERLTRAFHMLYSAFGPSAAYTFLDSVRRGDPEDDDYGYGEMGEADEYADDVADSDASIVTWEDVSREFSNTWSSASSRATSKKAKLAAKLEASEAISQLIEGSGYAASIADSVIDAARSAVARGLLPESSEAGLLWFNGIIYWQHPEMALFAALQKEMQHIQRAIYQGKLTDGSNVASTILRNSGALPRYSALVLGKSSKRSVIELNAEEVAGEEGAREVPLKFHTALKSFQYLPGDGSHDTVKKATYWVVTDMGTAEGQSLVWSALKFLAGKHSTHARVAFIHCSDNHTPAVPSLARLVRAATYLAADQDPEPLTRFLLALFQESTADTRMWMSSVETDEEIFQSAMAIADQSGLDSGTLMEELRSGSGSPELVRGYFSWLCGVLHSEFEIRRDTSGVVTNGRMVPSSGSVQGGLSEDDFHLMLVYADKAQHVGKIKSALSKGGTEQPAVSVSNQIMLVSNLLSRMGLRDDMQTDETSSQLAAVVGQLRSKKGALIAWEPTGGESSSAAALDVTAVVDPLTAGAQKLVPLLLFLRATIAPRIRVWLNPALDLSELPLKSFFRFALPSVSAVAGNGSSAPRSAIDPSEDMPGPPLAAFASLPQKKILTQNVHAPEAWLIEPVRAIYDTDNLLLADLPEGELMANADYELEALIISGSCIDIGATSRKEMTPRGVQLHLGNGSAPHVADTLVMSNLGYFQLQASPGIWSLRLAPGASSTLYAVFSSMGITEDGNRQTSHGSQEASVVLSSMNGRHTTLLLKKKPGHAGDDVLTYKPTSEEVAIATGGEGGHPAGEGTDSGMWGKLVSMFKSDTPMQAHDSLVINVFTIASGHMYERLQKIMILSVLRHATAPVKFWFIKNYMSPQMKAFLPHFARAYGFEYELVTYKWPRWLHKQTEKQRIIWAYKILFLDVLFPLSLEKVIFVDADQIIRDDLRKLVEMDLHGAPYAYTPFCDNNKDMDGYRFWKSGFWKTHLQGLPYHISALYIVDLKRFRETAAGDQLRIIYDQLSKDPNSLANLDQDLPNYAQHQVKIFSLPQEWLWCESWCGNSTKHLAKTIDLCNNPMTKEPKLQGARRIVAEWPGYDEEVQSFTARVDAVLEGDMEESALPSSAESARDGNLPHETKASNLEDGGLEDKSEL